MHEDVIFQDSPSAVPRREILSLKRFLSPVFFRPFSPHRFRVSQRSNQQAGDEDVAGGPGVNWLGYAQEESDEYPRTAPVQVKENTPDRCASRRAQGARIWIGGERHGTTRKAEVFSIMPPWFSIWSACLNAQSMWRQNADSARRFGKKS
jgi:hypothetical protein